jgi:hypothetical protein
MATSVQRAVVAAAGLVLAGCGFDADPWVVVLAESVGGEVMLEIPPDVLTGEDTEFDWQLIEAPSASAAGRLTEVNSNSAVLSLDVRGTFVVDRWLEVGTTDIWTHRFYVDSLSRRPVAIIAGPTGATLGDTITLDGRESADPEGASLLYQWRLVSRPRGSAAMLGDTTGPTLELTPDVIGSYELELEVFDGEVWSESPAQHVVMVNGPDAPS